MAISGCGWAVIILSLILLVLLIAIVIVIYNVRLTFNEVHDCFRGNGKSCVSAAEKISSSACRFGLKGACEVERILKNRS